MQVCHDNRISVEATGIATLVSPKQPAGNGGLTPFLNRTRVFIRNLWYWRTTWAVRYLSKQLQKDAGFRDAWQANIAMPIFDATRPPCYCVFYLCPVCHTNGEHCEQHCPEAKYGKDWLREMPADQCNVIADRLMKHLFGA